MLKKIYKIGLISSIPFILIVLIGIYFNVKNGDINFCSKAENNIIYKTPTPIPEISEDELWVTVNKWREENGYASYEIDYTLCGLADKRVDQIKTDWSHDGFQDPKFSNLRYKYEYRQMGENLLKDTQDPYQGLLKWLKSPDHKENLEAPYTHSCIRCENNYCVQLFAKY